MKSHKFMMGVSAVAVLLSVSACLDSNSSVSKNEYQQDFLRSQVQQYAQGLTQYSLASVNAVSNDPDFLSGAYRTLTEAKIVDKASIRLDGDSSKYINSAFCFDNSAQEHSIVHVTWLADENNESININGLGDKSNTLILSELSKVDGAKVATYLGDNQLNLANSNQFYDLPPMCASLSIPSGSTVIIDEIESPFMPTDSVVKTEYSTHSCGPGKTGHYLLKLDVETLVDGTRLAGGRTLYPNDPLPPTSDNPDNTVWTIVEDQCHENFELNTFATTASTQAGMVLNMASTNDVRINLEDSLSNINCKDVKQRNERHGEDENPEYGDYNQRPADESELEEFTTCGLSTTVEDINNVGEVRVNLVRNDIHTVSCGGSAGTYSDTIESHLGTVTHPEWNGNVTYSRAVYHHEAQNIMNASTSREMIENWVGQRIECDRQEDLNVSCNTVFPAFGTYSLVDSRGYNYERVNSISGWSDPNNLVPNSPDNPEWVFVPSQSGCSWQEIDSWECGTAGNSISPGQRSRLISAAGINDSPAMGSWALITPARCQETRVLSEACDIGSGSVDSHFVRDLTSVSPGVTSPIGDWRLSHRTGSCPCGGGCLFGESQVLMYDGSLKRLDYIEVGDITAAGRVLEKYQRPYNNGTYQTSHDLFMMNGGLYEFDGIVVTGRHPFYDDGQWIETGDSRKVTPIEGSQDSAVYNLLTEHHIIPVVGKSGNIHLYTDELNNINGVSEKGRFYVEKLLYDLNLASKAA